MSTFFIVIFIIIALLIAAILVLLYKVSEKPHRSQYQNAADMDDIHRYIEGSIDNAFRRHEHEFTAMYVEERRLAEWLKRQLEKDEINLASLAKEANERAIALTIKMAEDEVMLAANALKKVLNAITNAQGRLAISTENDYPEPVIMRSLTALKSLQTQEAEARERLTKAEANLEKVTQLAEATNPAPENATKKSSEFVEEQR